MATNKRKDATALFELIDKSTLKVPKRTGSLKIPSWWSSKTNPPGAAGNGAAGASASVAAQSAATIAGAAAPRQSAIPVKPEPVVQRRLYDPPAANAQAGVSPSIRPPVPVTPLSAGHAAALDTSRAEARAATPAEAGAGGVDAEAAAPGAQAATEPAKNTVADGQPAVREGYAGTGTGRRIFAPQTMSQNGMASNDWALGQKFRLARTPGWVLISAAAVLAVLVFGVSYLLRPHFSGPKRGDASVTTPIPAEDGPRPLTRAAIVGVPPTASGPAQTRSPLEPVKEPPATAKAAAQWFPAGAITRSATLYYIVIATSPSETISQRNADLLARHGVSVSVELLKSQPLYRLVSVDGFKTISDAQPLRKQIVAIGHFVDNYARTHKGWEDAMVLRGSSLPGSVAKN